MVVRHTNQRRSAQNTRLLLEKLYTKEHNLSVIVVWSVVSLPTNPAESEILIYIRELGVCPLYSVLCCLWRWP